MQQTLTELASDTDTPSRVPDSTEKGRVEAKPSPGDSASEQQSGDHSANTQSDSKTVPVNDSPTLELCLFNISYTVVEHDSDPDEPLIHLFGRDSKSELWHVKVHKFSPYFYVPQEEAPNPSEYSEIRAVRLAENRSIKGKDMVRVITHAPRDVKHIRDDFDHYEADILFSDRFRIDKNLYSGVAIEVEDESVLERTEENPVTTAKTINVHHESVESATVRDSPRVHYLDIEVNDRNGFPAEEDAEEPVLSIATYDDYADEYIAWVVRPPRESAALLQNKTLDEYQPVGDDSFPVELRPFQSEEEMLASYLSYVERTNPDLFTGWNVQFDIGYLLNRLDNLNGNGSSSDTEYYLSSDRLSRLGESWTSSWGDHVTKGRVVFDLLESYKRLQRRKKPSYRLEDTAQRELGVGKEPYLGKLGNLWEQETIQFLQYNVRDVELCVELNRKDELIDFWNETRMFVGCSIEDSVTPGNAVDMYILQNLASGYVLPSKNKFDSNSSDGANFSGGSVFEPMTGVADYVTTLDLKSLYPMGMHTINASPETKVDPSFDGPTYCAPNGLHFRKDTDGEMRKLIDSLLEERTQKKKLRAEQDYGSEEYDRYDRQQAAVKVVMNALFGSLGWVQFRLYDPEMSAAVTSTGRAVIEYTADNIEQDILYGDTDSCLADVSESTTKPLAEQSVPERFAEVHPELVVFEDSDTEESARANPQDDSETDRVPLGLCVPDALKTQYDAPDEEVEALVSAVAESFRIEEQINNQYAEFARDQLNAETHQFQLEAEAVFRRFFQAGKKKRYGGKKWWDEGEFVQKTSITGFEYRRSSTAPITKRVQKGTIDRIVEGESPENIASYLSEQVQAVRNDEVDVSDLAIPGGIRKPLSEYETLQAHQRGALYANALFQTNFGKGSSPKRVYLSRVESDYWERVESSPHLDPVEYPERWRTYQEFKSNPDVICFAHIEQLPDEFVVDREKMIQKTLQDPIKRVIIAIGLDWDAVREGQQQTGIGDYF